MRTWAVLVVATAAGALAVACGGRTDVVAEHGGAGASAGTAGGGVTGSSLAGGTGSTGTSVGGTGSGGSGGGTGSTGGTGGFAGGTGSTGSTGGFSGSVTSGGFSGVAGATGSSGDTVDYACPAPVPSGATCPDGGIPGVTSAVADGAQCFTTYGCAPNDPANQCTGQPTHFCGECADGGSPCSHYAIYNGVCTIETCAPPAGSTCIPNALCAEGAACSNSDSSLGCSTTCQCESGQLGCSTECAAAFFCQQGELCLPLGTTCRPAMPQGTCPGGAPSNDVCECSGNPPRYTCSSSCPVAVDGG